MTGMAQWSTGMASPSHVHSLWNLRTAPRGIRTSIRLVLQDGSWCRSGKIGGESLEAGRLTSAFTCTSTVAFAGHGGRVILAVGRQGNRFFWRSGVGTLQHD